jgi:hypothetical protein
VGKRGNVATVKTPEERGPLGAWAYDSRDRLDISPEQVVELLGKYDTSTIRKAEGNSEAMSRPLWRALTQLYARLASERSVTLDAMPTFGEAEQATGDQAALAAAINALVAELQAARTERAMTEARLRTLESTVESLLGPRDDATFPGRPIRPETTGSGR